MAEHGGSTDGRTRQRSLLLVAPVRPGDEVRKSLEALLREIAEPQAPLNVENNPVIPFRALPSIHFARILTQPDSFGPPPDDEPKPGSKPVIPLKLLFATDFDGTLKEHLLELIDVASPGLDRLFGHCEGWPGLAQRDRPNRYHILAKFVGRHCVVANTFYTGTMKRSVGQVLREAELREAIDGYLDEHVGTQGFPTDALGIRDRVRTWIFGNPHFDWVHQRPGPFPFSPPPLVRDHLIGWGIGAVLAIAAIVVAILSASRPLSQALAIVATPILVIGALVLAARAYLSYLAATDPVIIRRNTEHAKGLTDREDRIVQNQITTINYIKRPLWFRRLVVRSVLAVINIGARFVSTQGTLSGIPTIHFARWVVVDEGRRVLFFSNYDGSWESYLGDFVDKAHKGLTAIWSNCVGFPRTRGLFKEGAEDEQPFKALARDSQIKTDVWYSAYPTLTVSNINDNTRLRLGLYGDLDETAAQLWLRMAVPRQRLIQAAASAAKKTEVDRSDVQGLVARSYKELETAVYIPVTFTGDQQQTRAWLAGLIDHVTESSAFLSGKAAEAKGQVINVAFTYGGLENLGLRDRVTVQDFSREFTEGMATDHRKRLLGDTDEADPEHWKWGGPKNLGLHAMLFIFAINKGRLKKILDCEAERAREHKVTLGTPLDTNWMREKEHFGFNDGIAQPLIAGFGDGRVGTNGRGLEIPAGEVLLGFANAYDRIPLSPTVPDNDVSARFLQCIEDPDGERRRDLGRNGSYIVFRQLKQNVKAFWEDVDRRAQSDPAHRKLLAAKMVGRWPNGAPLVRYPCCEPAKQPDPPKLNNFWYRNDLDGDRCPVGAHIRRTNPRDGLRPDTEESLKVANRHRLLRRGRAYGQPIAQSFDPDDILRAPNEQNPNRGLHFICFNTDIARQFEFVQSTWANSTKFDGLYRDPDPLIAPNGAKRAQDKGIFTIQHTPVRQRHHELKRFVTPVGGAYLFMPGINALRYLTVAPMSGTINEPTGTRSGRD